MSFQVAISAIDDKLGSEIAENFLDSFRIIPLDVPVNMLHELIDGVVFEVPVVKHSFFRRLKNPSQAAVHFRASSLFRDNLCLLAV